MPSAFAQSRVCPHRAACATVGHTVGYALPCCAGYLEDAEAVAADVVGRPERVLDVEWVDIVVVARVPRQVRASALRGLCAHLRIDRLSHSALCQVCIRAAQPACPTQLAPWGSHLDAYVRRARIELLPKQPEEVGQQRPEQLKPNAISSVGGTGLL